MVSLAYFKKWLKMNKQEIEIRSLAIGLNSTVDITEDAHIIMLDYDIKDLAKVKLSISELQKFWNLSDADIFSTKNGFHVFFWYDIVPYERLKMIINYARYVDPMYKYISRYYDHKTIRVSGKYKEKDIVFVELVSGRIPTQYEQDIGGMKKAERRALE